MTLDAVEFLRRFFLHVLPKGFVRIRHYGLLSNRFRNRLLPLAHTSCSPPRVASNFPCHRCCRTANSGTVLAAVKPCVSSSASPPHNSICGEPSIPHDRLRQSASTGLAPCTSSHAVCAEACRASLQVNHVYRHPRTARSHMHRSCNCSPPAISIDDDGRAQKH